MKLTDWLQALIITLSTPIFLYNIYRFMWDDSQASALILGLFVLVVCLQQLISVVHSNKKLEG